MREWAAADAKARFSDLLQADLKKGPQIVTQHGQDVAVPTSAEGVAKQHKTGSTLKDVLLAGGPDIDFELPDRSRFSFD